MPAIHTGILKGAEGVLRDDVEGVGRAEGGALTSNK